jgi:hypothetical protein
LAWRACCINAAVIAGRKLVRRRRLPVPGRSNLRDDPGVNRLVEVVTAERRVAIDSEHFEHPARQAQNRDVEGAAAEIVDGVDPFARVFEPVGDRGRGRLVEQPQDIEPREPRGILGRLALRIVEIGRHGDHRAHEFAAECLLGALSQDFENLRGNLHRAAHARDGLDFDHAAAVNQPVGAALGIGEVREAASHPALHGSNGVQRVDELSAARLEPDLHVAAAQIAHHRWQQFHAILVAQNLRRAVANGRHKRIGRAEVDADGEPVLVRGLALTRFCDAEQRHQASSASRIADVGEQPIEKHQLQHGCHGGRVISCRVQLVCEFAGQRVGLFARRDFERAQRLLVAARTRLAERRAPFELRAQECLGCRLALPGDVDAAQIEQVPRSQHRRSQRAVSLVDLRRGFDRVAPFGLRAGGEPIRMHAHRQRR